MKVRISRWRSVRASAMWVFSGRRSTERTNRTERPITMSIFSPWFFHGWGVAQADREGQDDLVPVALLLLVLASSGWAARLADALGSGTPDDVIAVAQHAGPEELAAAVVGPDAVAARAAAFAAPAVQDGWSMLDELARAAGGWDRGRAVDAARPGLAIARGLDGDAAITADLAD